MAVLLLSLPQSVSSKKVFHNDSGFNCFTLKANIVNVYSIGMVNHFVSFSRLYFEAACLTVLETVYRGSQFVEPALRRAMELTDAAYTRTSER